MRTFTLTNTNSTVFGLAQDRVVKANREGCAPARPHLFSHGWRVRLASPASQAAYAFKRLVAHAARTMGMHSPSISGPSLCRLPVQSTRLQASVRG